MGYHLIPLVTLRYYTIRHVFIHTERLPVNIHIYSQTCEQRFPYGEEYFGLYLQDGHYWELVFNTRLTVCPFYFSIIINTYIFLKHLWELLVYYVSVAKIFIWPLLQTLHLQLLHIIRKKTLYNSVFSTNLIHLFKISRIHKTHPKFITADYVVQHDATNYLHFSRLADIASSKQYISGKK